MPLCDFLLEAPFDPAMLRCSDPLAAGYPGHRLDQLDAQILSELRAPLALGEACSEWPRLGCEDEEDGPWVHEFPEALAWAIEHFDGAVPSLVARWREAPVASGCDPAVLAGEFVSVRALLLRCRADGITALYWAMA